MKKVRLLFVPTSGYKNSALLPLIIQIVHIAKSPSDVDQLTSLPPWLQEKRIRSDAALLVLSEQVHSWFPLPQAFGAIGALHHI